MDRLASNYILFLIARKASQAVNVRAVQCSLLEVIIKKCSDITACVRDRIESSSASTYH